MGLLDRLKSMISEMSEEEKKEFFEEMENEEEDLIKLEQTEDHSEEEEVEVEEDTPSEIECDIEDVQRILGIRDQILQLKARYAEICLQADKQKEAAYEKIILHENMLLSQVQLVKDNLIEDESIREKYVFQVSLEPELSAKLVKN